MGPQFRTRGAENGFGERRLRRARRRVARVVGNHRNADKFVRFSIAARGHTVCVRWRASASTDARALLKRVLVISYFFPPFPGAGALRPGRLAKLLPDFGWTPTTLTGPWSAAGPEYGDVVNVKSLGDPIAPRIRGLWRVVSPAARWYPGALRAASSLATRGKFDAVISIYIPSFSHMLAASVAQRSSIPWLADYSEAWTGNRFSIPNFRSRDDTTG